ncbi:MAG TPA: hypothetical protein VKK79_14920 [Candidatus Lokiarchaeia archaeon]|nr:hypothetical protein [Candidatus Lokiarchaeia archaeon]
MWVPPGKDVNFEDFQCEATPSLFENPGATNSALATLISQAVEEYGPPTDPHPTGLAVQFPKRFNMGDLGLAYVGSSAVSTSVQILTEAIDRYIEVIAAGRSLVPSGFFRHFTNPNSNAFVKLIFYQLVARYFSVISCVEARVVGKQGSTCYEARLSELDDLCNIFQISSDNWSVARDAILSAVCDTAPNRDYAGRSYSFVESSSLGVRLHGKKYFDNLGQGSNDDVPLTELRALGFDPAGVILAISSLNVPVPGCGIYPEIFPCTGLAEGGCSRQDIMLTEER